MTAVEPFGGECPHGMEDPAWCSTCKNPRPRRTGHDVGPPVAAEFEGECPECGRSIRPGDTIRAVDGAWMHGRCVEL